MPDFGKYIFPHRLLLDLLKMVLANTKLIFHSFELYLIYFLFTLSYSYIWNPSEVLFCLMVSFFLAGLCTSFTEWCPHFIIMRVWNTENHMHNILTAHSFIKPDGQEGSLEPEYESFILEFESPHLNEHLITEFEWHNLKSAHQMSKHEKNMSTI